MATELNTTLPTIDVRKEIETNLLRVFGEMPFVANMLNSTVKFSDGDIEGVTNLIGQAEMYACVYTGDFEYIVKMREAMSYRLRKEGKAYLSIPQARGVLNCMLAELRRRAKAGEDKSPQSDRPMPKAGRYTILFSPDDLNDYVTIRLREIPDEKRLTMAITSGREPMPKGSMVASYLRGPDNGSDYTGFAFVVNGRGRIWKRFADNERIGKALEILLSSDEENLANYGEAYAMRSGRCWMCGLTLTVPISLARGLGPICSGMGYNV